MTLRLQNKIKSYNYVSVQTTNNYHKKNLKGKGIQEISHLEFQDN